VKFFNYHKKEDFGVEHIFTLIQGKRRSLLQVSIDWHEYPSGLYLQVAIGNNRLIDILFWCWKFGVAVELLGCTWGSWE